MIIRCQALEKAFKLAFVGVLSAVIIVTLIALDVLHPCTYLWVGRTKMTKEKASQLTWSQALVTRGWWETC